MSACAVSRRSTSHMARGPQASPVQMRAGASSAPQTRSEVPMWRSRVATLTGLVIIAVSVACGGGGGQIATVTPGKSGSGGTRIWAFSDANLVQTPSVYAARLAAQRDALCQTAEPGSRSMPLAQALASLEGALAKAAGPNALAQLANAKVGKSAGQAETVAAGEMMKANPGGALAALLIAHKDDTKEARHLENAAVVATSLGYPQEALALLAAAKTMPEAGYSEMGIDRTARMLNNQAYALIRLGRWAEAVPLLNDAIAREPLLNEAQRNLAVALTCQGKMQAAGMAQRAGERRNHFKDIGDPTQAQRFDPAQTYDLSQGKPVNLPEISYPTTLDQAAGASPKFESDLKKREAQTQAFNDEMHANVWTGEGSSTLTKVRTIQIESLVQSLQATPQTAQLNGVWQGDLQHMSDLAKNWHTDSDNATNDCDNRYGHTSASLDCFKKWCAGAQTVAHRGWLADVKHTDAALRAWAGAYAQSASGLASNLKDPTAHQWAIAAENYWLMSN